jgi:hypothetical protein
MFLTRGPMHHEALWSRWLATAAGLVPLDLLRSSNCTEGYLMELHTLCVPQPGADVVAAQHLFTLYVHPQPDWEGALLCLSLLFPIFSCYLSFYRALTFREVVMSIYLRQVTYGPFRIDPPRYFLGASGCLPNSPYFSGVWTCVRGFYPKRCYGLISSIKETKPLSHVNSRDDPELLRNSPYPPSNRDVRIWNNPGSTFKSFPEEWASRAGRHPCAKSDHADDIASSFCISDVGAALFLCRPFRGVYPLSRIANP